MKRLAVIVFGFSVLAMGCSGGGSSSYGSSASPSQPSAPTPAPGATTSSTTYTIQLSPANENPPIANADASSSGTATIVISATKDAAGNVTSATANFQVNGSGFPAGTTVTAAHIHTGANAVNGAIVVNTGLASGEMAVPGGAGAVTKNSVSVPADLAQAILKDPATYYFNVHTGLNPNGAMRGQLVGGGASSGGGDGGGTMDPYAY